MANTPVGGGSKPETLHITATLTLTLVLILIQILILILILNLILTPALTGGSNRTGIGPLMPSQTPPLRLTESFQAKGLVALQYGGVKANRWLFDFGQNVAGIVTLAIPAGITTMHT